MFVMLIRFNLPGKYNIECKICFASSSAENFLRIRFCSSAL
jgi:hypothetical protein